MTEEWREIAGMSGRYEVSSHGRVRSIWFKKRNIFGPETSPKVLRAFLNKGGYPCVDIPYPLGRRIMKVHRLVLLAFVGPEPIGHEGAHLNGRRDDPRLENLAWVTRKENSSHRLLHGTAHYGENNNSAKLSAIDVSRIRKMRKRGALQREVAAAFGIDQSTISNIETGRSWRRLNSGGKPENTTEQ